MVTISLVTATTAIVVITVHIVLVTAALMWWITSTKPYKNI